MRERRSKFKVMRPNLLDIEHVYGHRERRRSSPARRHGDARAATTSAAGPRAFLWESRVATVLDNDIFENTVGIKTVGGVVGPDNPTPFGAPGGAVVNRVFDNTTGILVAEGSAGAIVRHTDVYGNTVGIEAHGDQTQIVANDVHGNDIGIRSDREIGPTSWDANLHNLIHDNETGVVAQAGADVRFNRIYSNAVGVEVVGAATVHHDLIYRNTGRRHPRQRRRRRTVCGTTRSTRPGQSGVHLDGFIAGVDVRNNIVHVHGRLWAARRGRQPARLHERLQQLLRDRQRRRGLPGKGF